MERVNNRSDSNFCSRKLTSVIENRREGFREGNDYGSVPYRTEYAHGRIYLPLNTGTGHNESCERHTLREGRIRFYGGIHKQAEKDSERVRSGTAKLLGVETYTFYLDLSIFRLLHGTRQCHELRCALCNRHVAPRRVMARTIVPICSKGLYAAMSQRAVQMSGVVTSIDGRVSSWPSIGMKCSYKLLNE